MKTLTLIALVAAAGLDASVATPGPDESTVSYQEITLTLPGKGWQKSDEGGKYYIRVLEKNHFVSLNVWSVDPSGDARHWTAEQHVKAYFDFERHQQRPSGVHWTGFDESERIIGGRSYPVMSFEISQESLPHLQTHGVFVPYFTDDLLQRQRFYMIMWQETSPKGERGKGLGDLDSVITSLSIGPKSIFVLEPMMGLSSTRAATEKSEAVPDANQIAKRCVEATDKAGTYTTEYADIDTSIHELEWNGHVSASFRLDYVRPDRYHVVQTLWSSSVLDEWIDIGPEHYDSLAGIQWSQPPKDNDLVRRRLGQELRVDKYLAILRSDKPATATTYLYQGVRYYLLEYVANSLSSFGYFSEAVEGPYHVRIWVDAATGLLAKGEITGTTMKSDSKPAHLEIIQAFGDYGKFISIDSPLVFSPAVVTGQRMSADELNLYMQGYYAHPRPELIAVSIESLVPAHWVQNHAWAGVSFLGEVFLANPARVPEWRKLISQQDKAAQDYLGHAIDLYQSGGLLAAAAHWAPSSALNDMYWGAFFATGNPAFIEKLIDHLKYVGERKDQNLYFVGATAKWSLLANAPRHPLVLETLKKAEKEVGPRAGEIIAAMLKQSPEDAKREMHQVIDKQKAAGFWK